MLSNKPLSTSVICSSLLLATPIGAQLFPGDTCNFWIWAVMTMLEQETCTEPGWIIVFSSDLKDMFKDMVYQLLQSELFNRSCRNVFA